MTHTALVMGTVMSVVTDAPLTDATKARLADAFEELEARFSTYRPESEASRIVRREILVPHASPEFREVYDRALDWRTATGGAFTPHRPDGVIDLAGIVKALGIEAAGRVLDADGHRDWCVNVGGDVLARGQHDPATGRPWCVGIVDPADRAQLLTVATLPPTGGAVATSGLSERGDHIWRLGADDTFTQVTVVADDIVTADVLATAILAGGPDVLRSSERDYRIETLAVTASGQIWASALFRRTTPDAPRAA